jgi:hypothetical protein
MLIKNNQTQKNNEASMNKIKLAVGTFLLTLPQLAHSMEKKETQFNDIPRDVEAMIFEYAARDTKPGDLRLVCKDWQKTMDGREIVTTKQGTKYADIGPVWKKCVHAWYGFTGHEDALNQFLNGKLVCKPNKDNDEGRIEFKISDLRNPFAGQFDLSKCGNAGKYIAIMTGFRKEKIKENKDKVEVWLAPRALIEKFRGSTAKHFEKVLTAWDGKTAPLGLFYTWGNWENLSWCEYLTEKTINEISSKNLYENCRFTRLIQNHHTMLLCPTRHRSLSTLSILCNYFFVF